MDLVVTSENQFMEPDLMIGDILFIFIVLACLSIVNLNISYILTYGIETSYWACIFLNDILSNGQKVIDLVVL